MKLPHRKLKLLYLIKILLEQTDEEHTITVVQKIAECKRVYDDLEYLKLF